MSSLTGRVCAVCDAARADRLERISNGASVLRATTGSSHMRADDRSPGPRGLIWKELRARAAPPSRKYTLAYFHFK